MLSCWPVFFKLNYSASGIRKLSSNRLSKTSMQFSGKCISCPKPKKGLHELLAVKPAYQHPSYYYNDVRNGSFSDLHKKLCSLKDWSLKSAQLNLLFIVKRIYRSYTRRQLPRIDYSARSIHSISCLKPRLIGNQLIALIHLANECSEHRFVSMGCFCAAFGLYH